MSYTALYRRFRPQSFSELVGQEHISRSLAAAIRTGNIVHAYLFCGPRGTGKTSTAKILARSVNCLAPKENGDPCGKCVSCMRNLAGESLDVMEIDAASNRGIDEIRDLRERIKYAPAQDKYKVYIIDEVHMLTGEAFNALLKTLEEPPEHVIFILATTEPHKIPLTVLSRCQRYDFHRIADTDICKRILDIAAVEHIEITPEAAELIARRSEGGLRDALSLLDQCAAYNNGYIDTQVIADVSGSVDTDFLYRLISAIVNHDLSLALTLTEHLSAEGRDIRASVQDMLAETRDLLLASLGQKKNVPDWARGIHPNQYIALLQSFADIEGRLRYSLQPRITLELAIIKACGLPPESGQSNQATAAPPAKTQESHDKRSEAPVVKQQGEKRINQHPSAKNIYPAPSTPQTREQQNPPIEKESIPSKEKINTVIPTLDRIKNEWEQLLERVRAKSIVTYFFLAEGKPVLLEKDILTLDFPPESEQQMQGLINDKEHRLMVEEQMEKHWGMKIRLAGRILATPAPQEPKQSAEDKAMPTKVTLKAEEQSLF